MELLEVEERVLPAVLLEVVGRLLLADPLAALLEVVFADLQPSSYLVVVFASRGWDHILRPAFLLIQL